MSRIKRGVMTHKRHKKVLKAAKGFRGTRKTVFSHAKEAIMRAGLHAYMDRKKKKRTFRSLWIARLNAGLRPLGLSYSKFIHLQKEKNIMLDRKILADLAAKNPVAFQSVVDAAQK